jgi:hypothetical protein
MLLYRKAILSPMSLGQSRTLGKRPHPSHGYVPVQVSMALLKLLLGVRLEHESEYLSPQLDALAPDNSGTFLGASGVIPPFSPDHTSLPQAKVFPIQKCSNPFLLSHPQKFLHVLAWANSHLLLQAHQVLWPLCAGVVPTLKQGT